MRMTRLMQLMRDQHPQQLSSIEGFIDQLSVTFREQQQFEDLLRYMRQCLTKMYGMAFESRNAVADSEINAQIANFIHKMQTTFEVQQYQAQQAAAAAESQSGNSARKQLLMQRAQAAIDPEFQKLRQQFQHDFDLRQSSSGKLHTMIVKMKK